ncbi:hypothetical protein EON66_05570 [archaeon]|nr:MAG: hypothetical protein EON66_05570 [archaeon]
MPNKRAAAAAAAAAFVAAVEADMVRSCPRPQNARLCPGQRRREAAAAGGRTKNVPPRSLKPQIRVPPLSPITPPARARARGLSTRTIPAARAHTRALLTEYTPPPGVLRKPWIVCALPRAT